MIFLIWCHLSEPNLRSRKRVDYDSQNAPWEHYTISPPCFLAKYRKRRLNKGSFVLLYVALFAFSGLSLVSLLSVFSICLLSYIFPHPNCADVPLRISSLTHSLTHLLLQIRECFNGCSWQAVGHVSRTSSQSVCRKLLEDGSEAVGMQWDWAAVPRHKLCQFIHVHVLLQLQLNTCSLLNDEDPRICIPRNSLLTVEQCIYWSVVSTLMSFAKISIQLLISMISPIIFILNA